MRITCKSMKEADEMLWAIDDYYSSAGYDHEFDYFLTYDFEDFRKKIRLVEFLKREMEKGGR